MNALPRARLAIGAGARALVRPVVRARQAAERRALARSPRARTVRLALLGAVVVAALVAVGVLGVMLQHRHAVDVARVEGLDQARQRTEQVLSYTPQTAAQDVERAREGVTGPFADQFGSLLDQLVQPALARGLSTQTRVTQASVVSADGDRVEALLFLEQTATAPGQQPRVTPSMARVTASSVAGQWLISGLESR
jgi:Mce-associated membrane protein